MTVTIWGLVLFLPYFKVNVVSPGVQQGYNGNKIILGSASTSKISGSLVVPIATNWKIILYFFFFTGIWDLKCDHQGSLLLLLSILLGLQISGRQGCLVSWPKTGPGVSGWAYVPVQLHSSGWNSVPKVGPQTSSPFLTSCPWQSHGSN